MDDEISLKTLGRLEQADGSAQTRSFLYNSTSTIRAKEAVVSPGTMASSVYFWPSNCFKFEVVIVFEVFQF